MPSFRVLGRGAAVGIKGSSAAAVAAGGSNSVAARAPGGAGAAVGTHRVSLRAASASFDRTHAVSSARGTTLMAGWSPAAWMPSTTMPASGAPSSLSAGAAGSNPSMGETTASSISLSSSLASSARGGSRTYSTFRATPRTMSAASTTTATSPSSLMSDDAKYIVGTYARQPFTFMRGEGSVLFDEQGREYVDFYSGIAVNALGHSHPAWVKAVRDQADQLCHISNLYYTRPQVELAKRLVHASHFDKVFFCNSGTEANEAALKFARKYAYVHSNAAASTTMPANRKTRIVACNGGFHGRTIGALSMTYKKAYKTPFYPLMDGVEFIDLNDVEALKRAVTDETCAVIVEPIQGEGGVNACTPEFIRAVRECTRAVGALMICDEVQVGLGRVGRLFCHELFGVEPDIMTLAKPLAGGLPIGAVLVKQHVADVMKPGDHGTTFAGGPLVTSAAIATVDVIADPAFLADVRRKGALLVRRLQQIDAKLKAQQGVAGSVQVVDIRSYGFDYRAQCGEGQGLIVGFELNVPVKEVITQAAQRGVVMISAGDNTLRLVPPLVITEAQINHSMDVLEEILLRFRV